MLGKRIFAIDTATDVLSAAIATETGEFLVEIDAGPLFSGRLFDAIEALFTLARVEREEIDFFLCMQGPGAWTGLRIGFCTVQGFSFGLDTPVAALPTLDCIAFPHKDFDGIVIPALDAKQGKFFCGLYENGALCGGYLDASPAELAAALSPGHPALLTGPAAPLLFTALAPLCPKTVIAVDAPRRRGYAAALIGLARHNPAFALQRSTEPDDLLYIRASDAERAINPNNREQGTG